MNCPICQKPTEVRQTRKQVDGYVRYRVCFNLHRFKTLESVIIKEKK
jgi:transcriptional regulator NrdR family protein